MKATKRKSPAQLEKEAAEKQAAKTAAWHVAARKAGKAVRHTFVRLAKEAHGCEFVEAERLFEAAAKGGVLVSAGASESGVRFWKIGAEK